MRDESLALLATVGDLIAAVNTVDELLDAVCRVVVVAVADTCVVDLIEPGANTARSYVADADAEHEARMVASRANDPIRVDDVPAVFLPLFQHCTSVVLDPATGESGASDDPQRVYLAEHGIARIIAVPLLAGGRMMGMLSFIDRNITAPYVPDIVLVAEEVARHVAVAVEWSRSREATAKELAMRKRVEAELRSHAARQAALATFGAEALQTGDLQRLLERAVRLICEVLEVRGGAVVLVDPVENVLHVRATSQDGSVILATLPADPLASMAGFVLAAAAPVVSHDIAKEDRFDTAMLQRIGAVSAVSVPVRDHNQTLGAVGAFSQVAREFAVGEVHFLESIANVLGACLARQRQEDVLRQRQQEFEALVEGAPDMIWRLDLQGRYVYVNAAVERLGIP
ncbi:MAG: GAF domain-containing protein, partial [Deltaproteobacteria bacterium]